MELNPKTPDDIRLLKIFRVFGITDAELIEAAEKGTDAMGMLIHASMNRTLNRIFTNRGENERQHQLVSQMDEGFAFLSTEEHNQFVEDLMNSMLEEPEEDLLEKTRHTAEIVAAIPGWVKKTSS